MIYQLFFTKQAKKDLTKLNKEDKKRIMSTLERCRLRPHVYVKKLVASPYFRLRIGKFRAILKIDKGELVIMVLEIGHRRNIYK